MRDASEFTAQEIYDRDWKLGWVDPMGEAPLARLLAAAEEEGLAIWLDHESLMLRERYPGKAVIEVDALDGTLYYLVDRQAIPMLRGHASWDESRCWRPVPGEEAIW